MTDAQNTSGADKDETALDELQEDFVDEHLEEEGLLPLPKAEPTDGPAPGA